MPDLEKIIKGLGEAKEYFRECRSNASFGSKAENRFWELQNAMDEVAELLKAQEPQSVIVREEPQNGNILWFADCPKCKHGIERDKHKRFCGFCGQAVKWDE